MVWLKQHKQMSIARYNGLCYSKIQKAYFGFNATAPFK